jgi:hypothetical protein
VAEHIQSITAGSFPFPHTMREKAKKREKSEFARWLANKPVNSNNDPEAPAAPMLSMEDELMLAKLRELARPFSPSRTYAQIAEDGSDETGQYNLDFMVNAHVDEHI